jgi:hypothetical protein
MEGGVIALFVLEFTLDGAWGYSTIWSSSREDVKLVVDYRCYITDLSLAPNLILNG